MPNEGPVKSREAFRPQRIMDQDYAFELQLDLFLQSLDELAARLSEDSRVERVWDVLKVNYADLDLNLDSAAMIAGLSKNYFNTLVRERTGLTFHQLLIRYRLWKAISIMKSGEFRALSVAMEVGFGSLGTFERNFLRVLGSSPTDFSWRDRPARKI